MAMEWSDFNSHGTGYDTQKSLAQTSGGFDLDIRKNRVCKIQKAARANPVNKKAGGYKIMAADFQKMLVDKDSFRHRRPGFADRNVYVSKYKPNQLYSAESTYTNQSRGGAKVRALKVKTATWS
jgi:primary-amine oxidase